uniref:Uncharacterized protein n=1 Tax=Phlebotomus papatasi TaxID=29031 RepID=A0A1B0D2K9_PHLPP
MDALNYIFVTNPLSKGVWSGLDQVAKSVGLKPKVTQVKSMATQMSSVSPLWKLAGKNLYIVRLAGISGAGAVVLGAYGAHRDWETQNGLKEAEQARKTFDTANRYHFLHTIALLSIPIVRRPALDKRLFDEKEFNKILQKCQDKSCQEQQDQILLQPYHYISQIPGKQIRSKLALAFNQWLNIPQEKLNEIGKIVQMLHNSSLL